VRIEVRPGVVDDALAIATVNVEAWNVAYRDLVPAEYTRARTIERRLPGWQRRLLPGSGQYTLVAVVEGEVSGHCTLSLPSRDEDEGPTVAELASLYVSPRRQRAGIGSALVAEALVYLSLSGAWSELTLWTFSANAAARAFYERQGFVADGRVAPDPAIGIDEMRFRRSL
jgi:ribosomal protein S18 acetylase RimI-like enzyme